MRSPRNQEGFVLVSAISLLVVMIGLGLGLLLLTDNQRHASSREQASEAAFNVAEAALNAQIGQLSRSWPGVKELEYLSRCTAATSTATNGCPDPGSLNAGYSSSVSMASCPAGTTPEAWGSPLTSEWTTYVRDDGEGTGALFNSTVDHNQPTWDASGPGGTPDGKLWVRSVGVVQCQIVTLLSLVSAQYVTVPFPQSAVAGNWFETSNNGNKVIVDTKGTASQAGKVTMRCNGYKGTAQEIKEACEKYDEKHNQIEPNTTEVAATPASTLSAGQLEALKSAAKAVGTYFATGNCPNSLEALSGKPVYVEGPCELSVNGGTGNSEEKPGFLVIVNGTLKLDGNAEFFGTVYAVNAQNSSGVVVQVHGNSRITGTINVDGNGGVSFGSSHENLVYNGTAAENVRSLVGVAGTRNSFRILPAGQ